MKGGPDNAGKADLIEHLEELPPGCGREAPRRFQADTLHRLVEQLAVLGHIDGLFGGTYHLHHRAPATPSRARSSAQFRAVWPPMVGSKASGFSCSIMRATVLPLDGLDIGGIGHCRVGHDGGGIGVYQNDPVTLLAQSLTGLGAGVVELAGLANDNRPGAQDQNTLDIGSFGHAVTFPRPGGNQLNEMVKQRCGIVGTGAGFRVPLKAERRACPCGVSPASCRQTATYGSLASVSGKLLSSTAKP